MLKTLKSFAQDESGATAIEYGLIAGLAAIGVSVFVSVIGGSVQEAFAKVSTQLMSVDGQAGVSVVKPDPA
jgi:pilus assembly protein Flp/PilA